MRAVSPRRHHSSQRLLNHTIDHFGWSGRGTAYQRCLNFFAYRSSMSSLCRL